jgi:hypothetical protein
MIKQTYIVLILSLFFVNCNGQNKYFEPSGIVDKTEQYNSDSRQWKSLNDKERVDGYTRIGDSIFGGEIACNIEPLKELDLESFKVLAGTKYAKDKKHVYYPIEVSCVDYADCGVCYYAKIIVENANPSTFKYLGKEYATDGKNVYFRAELIKRADGKTFKIIDGPEFFYFATDKNNVYKHNSVFKNADPSTFYFDKDDKRTINKEYEHKYIIGDKDNEWMYIPPDSIKKVKKK